jgi:hypothetical protein
LWVPPHGAAVECPSAETAQSAASRFAGTHPGCTVAVYQLIGYAFNPVVEPEFTPAERTPLPPDRIVDDMRAEVSAGLHAEDSGAEPDLDQDLRDAMGTRTPGMQSEDISAALPRHTPDQEETLALIRAATAAEDASAPSVSEER